MPVSVPVQLKSNVNLGIRKWPLKFGRRCRCLCRLSVAVTNGAAGASADASLSPGAGGAPINSCRYRCRRRLDPFFWCQLPTPVLAPGSRCRCPPIQYSHDINDVTDLKDPSKLKILFSKIDDLLPQNLHAPNEFSELLAQAPPGQNESDVRVVKKWKSQRS